mmetsp:Transcript_62849/g.125989  ORF Transcript_62849/g.125989 Transcript_62849/m.125989 type:complete len:157 (-) Transcript_62849:255-725(-)
MLGIPEATLPPPWQQGLLRWAAWAAPALPVAALSNASELTQQCRDPERLAECAADELQYQGAMRLATAAACLDTAVELFEHLEEVSTPFLCLAAGQEVVVDPQGPKALMARASTPTDKKKLVTFEKAFHSLFCEPAEERAVIEKEIVEWVDSFLPR